MKNLLLILVFVLSFSQVTVAQKIISEYGGYPATAIKASASIPLQSDMVVNGATIECRNINTTQIGNVIGSTNTSVGGLCTDMNINKWSHYGPGVWVVDGEGKKVYTTPKPYQLGSFACYNHNAPKPTYYYTQIQSPLTAYKVKTDNTHFYVNVSVLLKRGEMVPTNIPYSTSADWNFVRVTATFNDPTLNRTLTGSQTISVGTDANPDALGGASIQLIDVDNETLTGTLTITSQYVNESNVFKADIEDFHYPVTASLNGVYIDYLATDYTNKGLASAYVRWFNYIASTYRTAIYGDYSATDAPQVRVYGTAPLPTTMGESTTGYIMLYQTYAQNGRNISTVTGGLTNESFDCFYIGGGGNFYKVTKGIEYVFDQKLFDIKFKTDYAYSATIKKVSGYGAD